MRELGAEYTFIYSERPDDAERIATLIDAGKTSAIICVGGDGTVQEFLGIALSMDLPIGVIPCGSANDFLYSLPETSRKRRSFEENAAFYTDMAVKCAYRRVDAVSINDARYFLNIGGTGIDIQVLRDALPMKKFIAGGAYFISLIKNAVTYREEAMNVTIDGEPGTVPLLLLAVCNGSYYGGHLRVAPPALIDDGLLTLCIVKKMHRLKRMAMFPLVKPGLHGSLKETSFVNCASVTLEFEGKRIINADGNLLEYESPLTFRVLKGAVKFIG